MDTFLIGYISGWLSIGAVYIFIQSIRGRKASTPGTLKERIDRNNNDTRQGLERSERILNEARQANTGLGNINKSAINGIDNTERIVSEIIANAKRTGKTEPKG